MAKVKVPILTNEVRLTNVVVCSATVAAVPTVNFIFSGKDVLGTVYQKDTV